MSSGSLLMRITLLSSLHNAVSSTLKVHELKKLELFMPSLKNLHISVFLTLLVISTHLVHSQAPGYEPPRTEFGMPDLQGIWTNRSITRMERNPLIDDGLVLTEERAYEMAQGSFWMSLDRRATEQPNNRSQRG